MLVGYARVSTIDQDTDLQLRALKRAGVRKIHQEKTSSVGQRPELHRLLASIAPGDVLTVYKLDRVARSLKDLLSILERLEAAGAGLRSLTEPIDTHTPAGRLMLQMLGAVAEFERSLIRERAIAGQIAAIARGRWPGRPPALTERQRAQVARWWAKGLTKTEIAKRLDVKFWVVDRVVLQIERPSDPRLQPRRPVLGPLLAA